MSVINALGDQWSKAEFAHQLALELASRPGIAELFGGATSLTTVCNLIAAMSYQADDARFAKDPERSDRFMLTNSMLISVFHDCFRLLFIKEVQSGGLSQAEQLILALAKRIALDTATESLDDHAILQREQMIKFSEQLEGLYRQRRNSSRNMV
ncbi:hypothetical protein [Shewanella sp. GXUN23E]|uniref:hypothetical protein n=1 Tax=Shewanella sp. GXUN23E TaxID=3422498 RepID=UPI003D7D1B45